jgi:hypothetical protein
MRCRRVQHPQSYFVTEITSPLPLGNALYFGIFVGANDQEPEEVGGGGDHPPRAVRRAAAQYHFT